MITYVPGPSLIPYQHLILQHRNQDSKNLLCSKCLLQRPLLSWTGCTQLLAFGPEVGGKWCVMLRSQQLKSQSVFHRNTASGDALLSLSTPLPGWLLAARAELAGQTRSLQPVSIGGDEKGSLFQKALPLHHLPFGSAQLFLTLVAYWDTNLKPSGF